MNTWQCFGEFLEKGKQSKLSITIDNRIKSWFKNYNDKEIERMINAIFNILENNNIKEFKEIKNVYSNAQMPGNIVRKLCQLTPQGTALLKAAMTKQQLSARAYDRILKVSRTIADLAGSPNITIEHLAEAIHFRSLDKESWMPT